LHHVKKAKKEKKSTFISTKLLLLRKN